MRIIDADALAEAMYHEAFETDSDMQKWDSGCWIRYKLFENTIDAQPTIKAAAPEWILCEDRLPEEGRMVITTIKGTDLIKVEEGETISDALIRAQKFIYVDVGFVGSDGWYRADCYPMIVTPIAWMPLPEPYEEHGMEEFMYGQDPGDPEDGRL